MGTLLKAQGGSLICVENAKQLTCAKKEIFYQKVSRFIDTK